MAVYTDFYKRVWGLVNVGDIVVTEDNRVITIRYSDNTMVTINLLPRTYKWDNVARRHEAVDAINTRFEDLGHKLRCYLGGVSGPDRKYDCFVFQPTDSKTIIEVEGSFGDSFFD